MKKNRTEQQKDRAAIFDLAQGLMTIIVVGATLGALYESPWPLYFKVIIFGFMFLLGLILSCIYLPIKMPWGFFIALRIICMKIVA